MYRVLTMGAAIISCLFCLLPSGSAKDLTAPEAVDYYLQKGTTAYQERNYSEAASWFESVLRLDADNETALKHMRAIKAYDMMDVAAEQARRKEQFLQTKARELAAQLAREKSDQASTHYLRAKEQMAQARERQVKLLYTRGLTLYRQGAYQQAIEMFQQLATLDPKHPLVISGQQLMAQAEMKLSAQQAQAGLSPPAATQRKSVAQAKLPELEQLVTVKRMEQETGFKYAQQSVKQRQYDQAIVLLQQLVAQDPTFRPAQDLLQQAQLAKLKEDGKQLEQQVAVSEANMMNDVTRAQLTKETQDTDASDVRPVSAGREGTAATLARLQEPISFDFQDVAFSDVLDFLADAATVSVIPSPRIDLKQERVSLKVDHLPLEMALKYLVKNQNLAYRVEDGVILIAPAEEFANETMDTHVFFLRSGLGPFALETSTVESNPLLELEPFKKLIEQSVPQPSGSKLIVDPRLGALVATNTKDNLLRMEDLLSQLDVTPVQVLIEARFIEVTLTELEQAAFESVLTGALVIDKAADGHGGVDPANVIARGGGIRFPALSRESEALNVTLEGVMTGTKFESVLHWLEETQKSKTLSAPRVTALNNQPAMIKVVDEFRYPTKYETSLVQFDVNGDGDFDDAGETEFVNVPQDFQKRDIGILLNVTPSVGRDLKTMTLVLAPEVSQFSQFRDLGGGVTVPEFTSSQLTTSITLKNGQTVVLGGLMKDTVSEQLTKVPVLGDLPLVGGMFRQREQTQTRKNLLIFVTARVLAPRGQTI